MTQHEKERIEILERRADYLEQKVKDFPEDKNVDYKKHEASAIRWAIENLSINIITKGQKELK